MAKNDFHSIADNVTRSWHWFSQVTAPCNVACGSGITKVNSPGGRLCNVTRSSGIMTLSSPGGSTLQCGRVAGGSGMTCYWTRPDVPHIGILHLVSISTISLQSTCHSASVCKILSKSGHPRQKKNDAMSIFKMADLSLLDFRGPIMGSLKSARTTSYRSSIETIALSCLVFEKIAFFYILATDRQTNKQTDRWTDRQHRCTKPLSLSRAAANNNRERFV